MSFLDIKDPTKRDQIVKDYFHSIKELKQKSENDKTDNILQKLELEQTYQPIINASKESTTKITNEIKKKSSSTRIKKRKVIGKKILLTPQ